MARDAFALTIAALAILAGAAALAFVWQPGIASLYDDSVAYLVMAQALSPWSPPSAAIAAAFPIEKFPPAFPFVVALVGGAHDWRIAHAVVAAGFAASVLLSGWFAREATGSRAAGVATAATMALLPGAWLNLKGVLTEFPYLALSLAALVWHRRISGSRRGMGAWMGLGALLAVALLTRTIGVALVAAVAAVEALRWRRSRGDPRPALVAVAIPLAAAALWYALRPAGGEDAYVASGVGLVRCTLEHGPAWLLASMGRNAGALGFSWLNDLLIFWEGPWQPKVMLAAALGWLALAGTAWRAARGTTDGLYAAFYLAILLAWPFPAHMYRLGLPIIPVLLAGGWWALGEALARGAGGARRARFAAVLAFTPLVLCVPAVLFYVAGRARAAGDEPGPYRVQDIAEFYRIPLGPWAASVARRQLGVLRDMDRIRETTPLQARVMWYLPDYVALLAGRRGLAIPPASDAAAFAAEMRRRRPDYVYVTAIPLRDEGTGGDDPLAPQRLAAPYAETVWTRTESGKTESVLLRIDREKLEAPSRP